MPPLNAIAAKLQDFNECIMGDCSFVPMCVYTCMEATEKDGMGESKCKACVSKQKSCKSHCCCFHETSAWIRKHAQCSTLLIAMPELRFIFDLAQSFSTATWQGPKATVVQTAIPKKTQELWFYFSLFPGQKTAIG